MPPKSGKTEAPEANVLWTKEYNVGKFEENKAKFPPVIKVDKDAGKTFFDVYAQCLAALQMAALPCFQLSLHTIRPREHIHIHSHDIDSASATIIGYALAECTDAKKVHFMDVVLDSLDIFTFTRTNPNIAELCFEQMSITAATINLVLDALQFSPFVTRLAFRSCRFAEFSLLCRFLASPRSCAITHLTLANCSLGEAELELLSDAFCIDKRVNVLEAQEALGFVINRNNGVRFLNLEGNGLDASQTRALLSCFFAKYAVESHDIQLTFVKKEIYQALLPIILANDPAPALIENIRRVGQMVPSFEPVVDSLVRKMTELITAGRALCYPSTTGGAVGAKGKGKEEVPALLINRDVIEFLRTMYTSPVFTSITDEELHVIAIALPPRNLQSLAFGFHPTKEYAVPNSSVLGLNIRGNTLDLSAPGERDRISTLLEHTSLCYMAFDEDAVQEPTGGYVSDDADVTNTRNLKAILAENRKRMAALEEPYDQALLPNAPSKKK